ncbi:Nucleolar protein 16 [Aphelenchoides besseyi]|nr:Nucleolar protein 16 [Aphelenchoides besseyi]
MRSEKAVKRRHVRCPHRRHHKFRALKQQRSSTANWKTNTYFDCKWKQPRVVQEIQVRVPKQTSQVKSNEHVPKPKKHVDNQATAAVEKTQRAEKEQKRQQELELKKQKQKELEAEKRAAKEQERKEKLAREESERAAKEEQLRQKQAQEEANRLAREKEKQQKAVREKAQREAKEKERLEKERLEKERLEKERLEKERAEKERLEKERLEKERLEKERAEKERLEKEQHEKERLEKERLEQERAEKERLEKEQHEKERLEQERHEKERLEKERAEKERAEKERLEQERLEKKRVESEEKSKQADQNKKSQRKNQKNGKSGKRSKQPSESQESANNIEEVQTKTTIQQNGTIPNGITQNGTQQNGINEKANDKPADDKLLVEVVQQNNKSVEPAMISSVDSGVEVAPETKNKNGLAVEEHSKTSGTVTPVRSIRQEIEAKQTEIFAQITEFVTFAHSKLAKTQTVHSEEPRKRLNFKMPEPLPPRNIEIRKRERAHRLLPQDVDFCVYMIETYGDDFEGMSKDPKNRYRDDAKQISRKIRIFRNSVHYQEYLAEKNGTATTD